MEYICLHGSLRISTEFHRLVLRCGRKTEVLGPRRTHVTINLAAKKKKKKKKKREREREKSEEILTRFYGNCYSITRLGKAIDAANGNEFP